MTNITNKTYTLNSGYDMPTLGLGTWKLSGKECVNTVRKAIELGYRHIDTAEAYENESDIGKALQDCDRNTLFITSKAAREHLAKIDLLEACEQSLSRLKMDYLDLYLAHWPNDDIALEETLEGMRALEDKGMVRSIGLSNYGTARITQALELGIITISNLQIEYHLFTPRESLPAFCRQHDISLTAYSPLAQGKVCDEPVITDMAKQYDKTAAQISLRWLVQKGCIVIPKASSERHLRENMELDNWSLAPEDMNDLNNIHRQERLVDTTYT